MCLLDGFSEKMRLNAGPVTVTRSVWVCPSVSTCGCEVLIAIDAIFSNDLLLFLGASGSSFKVLLEAMNICCFLQETQSRLLRMLTNLVQIQFHSKFKLLQMTSRGKPGTAGMLEISRSKPLDSRPS